MSDRKCEKYSFLDCHDHVCNEACNIKQLWNRAHEIDKAGHKNANSSNTVGERDSFLPVIEAPIFCGVFVKERLKEWVERINEKFVDDNEVNIYTQYHHGAEAFQLICGSSSSGPFVVLAGVRCDKNE